MTQREPVGAVELDGHPVPPPHAEGGEAPGQLIGVPVPVPEGELAHPDDPVAGLVGMAVGHDAQLVDLQW